MSLTAQGKTYIPGVMSLTAQGKTYIPVEELSMVAMFVNGSERNEQSL
jgi:hypothetical protein